MILKDIEAKQIIEAIRYNLKPKFCSCAFCSDIIKKQGLKIKNMVDET